MCQIIAYIKFLLKSTNEHGVHSPFVYNFITKCLYDKKKYNNYDDLITVNDDYKRSGSVRVFKYEHLKNKFVSKRMGVIKDSATDIHYKNDLDKVKEKYD